MIKQIEQLLNTLEQELTDGYNTLPDYQTNDEGKTYINGAQATLYELQKQIKELEEAKTASKKEVGNLKRKLTNSKKKTQKMQEAYDNDEVESAEDFLRQFAKK